MTNKNPHAVALGRLGGLAGRGQPATLRKAEAARRNGKLGGRPRHDADKTPTTPRHARSPAAYTPTIVENGPENVKS